MYYILSFWRQIKKSMKEINPIYIAYACIYIYTRLYLNGTVPDMWWTVLSGMFQYGVYALTLSNAFDASIKLINIGDL